MPNQCLLYCIQVVVIGVCYLQDMYIYKLSSQTQRDKIQTRSSTGRGMYTEEIGTGRKMYTEQNEGWDLHGDEV